ncbi:MAG: type II secretion system F family protein [Hyphomonadaceae bacterium]|nr:type II secretion system F family protein [Hyphomonadaceae bacterium]
MSDLLSSANMGILLLAVALLAAAPGVIFMVRASGVASRIDLRLSRRSAAPSADLSAKPQTRIADRLASIAARAAPKNKSEASQIRFRLLRARYTHPQAVALFYGARLLSLILFPLCFFVAVPFLPDSLPGWFPLAGFGFTAIFGLMLPGILVDRRIQNAELECSDGFPDMMDLLVACVEAGLSLDAAVLRVSEELENRHRELSLNLKTLALEMRAGRARKAAWRAFADRVGLEEASSLATMLRQSEEMGTSLGETLRVFSSDMRQRRMLMAEEKAMALPAKMTVPLILFVFPVLLGVLIVPAIIRFQSFM